MARRMTRTLTEVELEFMQVLWSEKEASPEDMQNALLKKDRFLTGGSIRKMLSILMRKGYVKRTKLGKKYVYSAHIQKDQANRSMLHDLLDRAFGGSPSLMVAALLDTKPIPGEDVEKIERLISQAKEARK